jgi:hypothetical protein
MIVGNPSRFAIESEFSVAYSRPSHRALGFFVIYLEGTAYGVRSDTATLLACSFDEVEKRLRQRGTHIAPFAAEPDAGAIADAVAQSIYETDDDTQQFWGLARSEFVRLLRASEIVWAPDGDAAFDDGSCVIQFDDGDNVRVIGFKYDDQYRHIPSTLKDVWLDADQFYDVMGRWLAEFALQWSAATKAP